MATDNPIKPREIGEIAIRCGNIDQMYDFYSQVIGLEVMSDDREEGTAFLRIGDGYNGHQTIVALFLPDAGRPELHPQGTEPPATGATSSLHHVALTVDAGEQDAIKHWLDQHNISWREQVFEWVGWRGIFFSDPEGNTIELVAADKSFRAS